MSLLHQEDRDDAAKGEELTKGTSHVLIAFLVATVVVAAAIAIYVIAGQKPPAATGEIVAVWAHPQHTETSGFDASGAPMAKESFDQVLVFTQVKLHNQSDQPLFLHECIDQRHAGRRHPLQLCGQQSDYDRVFIAYPSLTVPHGQGSRRLTPRSTLDKRWREHRFSLHG